MGALIAFARAAVIEEGAVDWNRGRRNTRRSLLSIRGGSKSNDALRRSRGERRQTCISAMGWVYGV